MNKLLLIGSDNVHIRNYYNLVSSFFSDVKIISNGNSKIELHNVELVDFSLKNPVKLFNSIKQVSKIIEDYKPDIIHVHQANVIAFIVFRAAIKTNIPKVLTTWGSDILILPSKNILLREMVKYNVKQADIITADAHYLAESVNKLSKTKNEIVIANFGIDIIKNEHVKEKIIYSNRLHKKLYNIDKIILAFKEFYTSNKDWKLIIAATGEETESLKNIVIENKLNSVVEFVGWLNKKDNLNYYMRSSIYMSIPESDATSISLLEAMAYGCIPVVSDLPSNREWIRDKVNGIIFNKESAGNSLNLALQLDVSKLRMMNQEIINKEGTKEVNREKFIKIYKSLLNGKS